VAERNKGMKVIIMAAIAIVVMGMNMREDMDTAMAAEKVL